MNSTGEFSLPSRIITTPGLPVPIKIPGGKRQLLHEILPRMPAMFDRYFEPFLGGGALFFALRGAGYAGPAFLNDANPELMAVYQGLQLQRAQVEARLMVLSDRYAQCVSREKRQRFFLEVRTVCREQRCGDLFPGLTSEHGVYESARAAAYIFLNRTSFNGVWRANKAGEFNTSFGEEEGEPKRAVDIVRPAVLSSAERMLQGVHLSCEDFEVALTRPESVPGTGSINTPPGPGDFCYFDPPYVPLTNTACFTQYTGTGFTFSDQLRLVRLAQQLVARGVFVLLSNHDIPAIRQLYAGFAITTVKARRKVNSDGKNRGPVNELLISGC